MNTLAKIDKLNEACDGTLSFIYYTQWQISAFRTNSPLSMEKHYPFFEAKTLKQVVDKAYEFVFGKEDNEPS